MNLRQFAMCLIVFLATLLHAEDSPAPAQAQDGTRLIAFGRFGYMEVLSVSNQEFTVSFVKNGAWTLRDIIYKGKPLNIQSGASGTVVHWINPKTGKLEWAGTGHGRETVNEVALIVDGTTNRLVTGGKDVYDRAKTFSGRKVSFLKQSTIGPISHEARFDLPATGSYYVVTQRYVFNETVTPKQFRGGYTFMQLMPRTINEWLTCSANGSTQDGKVDVATIDADEKSKQTSVPLEIFKTLVCYSPALQMGIAYAYAQEYPGKNFILQRPRHDIKYYGSLMTNACYKAGDKLEFRLKVIPFEAQPAEWKAKGIVLNDVCPDP